MRSDSMQDILRMGVTRMSHMVERRQINRDMLLLRSSKRCNGYSYWVVLSVKSQMVR